MEEKDENLRIGVFLKKSTKRNPWTLVLVMERDNNWGVWDRIFKHRGILPDVVCSRRMVEKEIELYKKSWRMLMYRYKHWENLIIDEWELTEDAEWCKVLIKHSGLKGSGKIPKELFI